ncbi:hypothetical protein V5O48_008917 [Marasmius crinis-equi]|uniref:Uncharacterized protein n=1 Tax=Marasmius crinis-equi TaxID=585013 RepID=A0ABR3FCQ0_9AGAR
MSTTRGELIRGRTESSSSSVLHLPVWETASSGQQIGPMLRSHSVFGRGNSPGLCADGLHRGNHPGLCSDIFGIVSGWGERHIEQVPGFTTIAFLGLKSPSDIDFADVATRIEGDVIRQQAMVLESLEESCTGQMGISMKFGTFCSRDGRPGISITGRSVIYLPDGEEGTIGNLEPGVRVVANVVIHKLVYMTEEVTEGVGASFLVHRPSEILKVLMSHDNRATLLGAISPMDMFSLAMASGFLYQSVQPVWAAAFNYTQLLSTFIPVAKRLEFWTILLLTDSLVSGSTVLQLFARLRFADADLDVYCYYLLAEPLLKFLAQIGYIRISGSTAFRGVGVRENYSGQACIWSVVTFEKGIGGTARRIQVILTMRSPVEAVLCFHSTVVMNIITPFRSFCLYPFETLHLRQSVSFDTGRNTSPRFKSAIKKYQDRGWEVLDEPSVESMMDNRGGFLTLRAMGDRWSFGIAGPLTDATEASGYLKLLTAHGWGHTETQGGAAIRITLKSPSRFAYAPSLYRFCLPSDARLWPMVDAESILCIEEQLHTAVELCGKERAELLSRLSSKFLVKHGMERCPARGLALWHLARFLYPLYAYFRALPQLKVVFTLKNKVFVRVCVLLSTKAVPMSPDVICWNHSQHMFSSPYGFEVLLVTKGREYEIFRKSNRATTVTLQLCRSSGLHVRWKKSGNSWRRLVEGEVQKAIDFRRERDYHARMTEVEKFDDRAKKLVVEFIVNGLTELDVDDVELYVEHRRDFITITIKVPDEWLPREEFPLCFTLNRLLHQRLRTYGFAVEFGNASGRWL